MEDTAVLEQDTAVEEVVEEQPVEEQPESLVDTDAPETEAEESPETEAPNPFAELSDEDLTANERIQKLIEDREARARESARRKTEHEERKRQADQVRKFQQDGQAVRYLNGVIQDVVSRIAPKLEAGEHVDSSERMVNPQLLNAVASQMRQAAVLEGYSAWDTQLDTQLPVGDKVDAKVATEIAELRTEVQNGNFDRFHELIEKRLELGYEARLEKELPKLKKQWEADFKKQQKAAEENARSRAADETETTEPTSRSGSPAKLGSNRDILDNSGKYSRADYVRAYREEYGIAPPR